MVKKTFGIILLVIGFICVAGYIDDANNGRNKDRAMSVVMAGLFLLGGAALLRSARSDAAQTEASAKSAKHRAALADGGELSDGTRILRAAHQLGGRVTIAEIAADTALEVLDVKRELDAMARENICQLQVGEEGVIVYDFPEFVSDKAKLPIA